MILQIIFPSHSFRVAMIGWQLALMEGVDSNKVLKMCLIHDVPEIRSEIVIGFIKLM
ncbi:MAG: HD domain-containing protein [Candidatus Paceibacterota bacterium]